MEKYPQRIDPNPGEEDQGLAYDLQILDRRRALAFLSTAGAAVTLVACGGGSGSSSSSSSSSSGGTSTSTSTSGGTTTTSSTSGGTTTTTSSTSGGTSSSCVANASETNGPYPADGTNTSSGATSNVLQTSGVVRSDIRSSFISSTTTASGVLLTITLQLVDASNSCAPVAGAAIYLWHCTATGLYSLYSSGVTTESYLRGVQVTDSNGEVTFTTIWPGCYDGRWPHMHFEVFEGGLTSSSTGRTAALISQIAMPAATCNEVYATSGYGNSLSNLSKVSLSSDNVFGDNSSAQMAQMTASATGSTSAGYTSTVVIGL